MQSRQAICIAGQATQTVHAVQAGYAVIAGQSTQVAYTVHVVKAGYVTKVGQATQAAQTVQWDSVKNCSSVHL